MAAAPRVAPRLVPALALLAVCAAISAQPAVGQLAVWGGATCGSDCASLSVAVSPTTGAVFVRNSARSRPAQPRHVRATACGAVAAAPQTINACAVCAAGSSRARGSCRVNDERLARRQNNGEKEATPLDATSLS